MRSHQLLLTSALLSQAIDSSIAFQIPQRNIIAGASSSSSSSSFRTRKTKSSSRSATRDNGLITKLIPTLRKSSTSKTSLSKKSKSMSHPRKKREDDDTVTSLSNKQILALATTCCVTCLLRPTTARAAAAAAIGSSTIAVVDPMMITYDMMQVSNLGRMPPTTNTPLTVMPGMYTLFYNALRRYSPLVLASSLLVVTAFMKSVMDGLSYWKTLSDEFENDDSAIIEEFYQVKPMDYVQYSHVLLSSSSSSSSDDDDQIKQEKTTTTTTTSQEIPTSFSSSRSSSSQVVEVVTKNTSVELNVLVQKSQEYEEDIQESLTKNLKESVEDDYLGSVVE